MSGWNTFASTTLRAAALEAREDTGRIQRFAPLTDEYRLLHDGPALVDRNYVGVLEITGADRAAWLHNLTTNQIKNLGNQEGVYAFALNVQGRILFDLQVLNLGDRLWCIINHSYLDLAIKHLDRYLITEDVTITNRSSEFVRFGLCGKQAAAILAPLGLSNAGTMAALNSATCSIAGTEVRVARNDFCGVIGFDLYVPVASASRVWSYLSGEHASPRAIPIGDTVVEIARIEAGLPCPLREINNDVLPAETGQFSRAVSYTKGCYLGQEIVERMRSRGVVARMLSGLRFDGEMVPPNGASVHADDGAEIGTITSTCRSMGLGVPIALAYLKTGWNQPDRPVQIRWDDESRSMNLQATIQGLPFAGDAVH